MFITIQELRKVNSMYRFSLAYFVRLFQKCLITKNQNFKDMVEKLGFCSQNLNKIIFNSIAQSLFKQDRLMLGLHFVKGIMSNLFALNEWDFFLGNAATSLDARVHLPRWASEENGEKFSAFCHNFGPLASQINFNDKEWERWCKEYECEKEQSFPSSARSKLTAFQKVLIV